uniref:Mitochondrial import receptor subunit TOM22 homolog n=1 Tax=Steinernema glaseri TaxID=37863 RepID=A0A1I8A007_9BILA
MSSGGMEVIGGDEWDRIPDDELEETLWERVEGLGEMFPSCLRSLVSGSVSWGWWSAHNGLWLAKSSVWVISTSAMIMMLPYVIEKERSDMEKQQVQQQRQMLLGPTAAVANASKQAS